jgi:hypothetical protein
METAPYHRFKDFIAPGVDRLSILKVLLEECSLSCQEADIAGNRHLFVFPGDGKSFSLPWEPPGPVVLIAHYDRAAGSPGANDNSAAVFQLIETALRLRERGNRRWLVIFTDKEELSAGESLRAQGAYGLAMFLKDSPLGKSRFYIFDACGVGDTLVISTMADHLIRDEEGPGIPRIRQLARELREQALETARDLLLRRVLLAPTPFSDDAGFLRAGVAAQTITVLPASEAARLASLLRNKPDFIDTLISREARDPRSRFLIPETWRSLNGPGDSALRLTPKNYKQVVHFAAALCGG